MLRDGEVSATGDLVLRTGNDMTITSIGSSFSYIRPDAAARETAASAAREEAREVPRSTAAATDGDDTATTSPREGRAPSVADDLRAVLVKTQETHATAPSPSAAARAYGGR